MHHFKVRTMKEAYVSFEVAKLLKEKGFDGECRMRYREHDKLMLYYVPDPNHIGEFTINAKWIKSHTRKNHIEYLLAPTHQMACAWLREVHNMHIDIDPSEGNWHPCVIELETWTLISDGNLKICDTYEEAVEAALKYSLENLR